MSTTSGERPARLDTLVGKRLAVPGVIGMRDPCGVSFSCVPHVVVGPDAGFPEFQQLDEWKNEVALVDPRSVAPEVRAEAGIKLPEDEIAYYEELMRDPFACDFSEDIAALRLARRARVQEIDDEARRVLSEHGIPFWVAGYTRYSATLWLRREGGTEPFALWVSRYDFEYAGAVPAGGARFPELVSTRWADRVLRACSGGAVSEPAMLFARSHRLGLSSDPLVEDEVARAAVDAAASIAAGHDVVDLPLHGPVRRVHLPGFTGSAWTSDPFDAGRGGQPLPARSIEVPSENVYVPIAQVR
jgi:hypothetical protein